ncbi:Hypothetical predicted protein [Paramuricea clavata]|uniref:Uncharacterized protein n=1 Tax=Paramuricea clavata TaxID=317549 RepID=A0A7D9M3G6_PARCT|nr:Hypothetical predicted protein [Paramuricea clavata]
MHGGRKMRTRLPLETYCDDIIDREQVINTKAKMVYRTTCAKEHRLKVGDQVVVMQKRKNKDASKFRKLYGSLPRSSKSDGEEMHEEENDTNEQFDNDEHEEDENYNEVDIEQDNEGANDVNIEPPMARPERERQPAAWLRDYET